MKPVKFKIKLRENERPDISVIRVKKLIEKDDYVHPSMVRTLKLLKKMRTPFIRLPILKEMVIDLDNHVYFERSIKPENKPWVKSELCEEEIIDYEKDKEGYLTRVHEMYTKYLKSDFYDTEDVTPEYLANLYDVTKSKKNKGQAQVKVKRMRTKRSVINR